MAVAALGPVSAAVDHAAARAADAFAAVARDLDGFGALGDELFVQHVEHLEERHVFADAAELVGLESAVGVGPAWRQTLRVRLSVFSMRSALYLYERWVSATFSNASSS